MTVATDAVFEMPEDGDNEGTRLSDQDEKNIADPEQGRSADGVDESNVPHADMDLSDGAQE